jgi:hypothetical protein
MLQFFRNKNISKKLKLRLKNTIDKTLTCASETWIPTEIDRKEIFLKGECIEEYDNEKENWRILTNKEIYAMVKKPTITERIRLKTLHC